MSQYLIKDPWSARVRDLLQRVLVCSWRGHQRLQAFGGGVKPCRRCGR